MGFDEPSPKDMRLKLWSLRTYFKILQAMYQLRDEEKYVISWRLLSERTTIEEGVICDAALELRAGGFFDGETQEHGVVSLTSEQFRRGLLRSRVALLWELFKRSRVYWLITGIYTLLVWFGVIPNFIMSLFSDLWDFFKNIFKIT